MALDLAVLAGTLVTSFLVPYAKKGLEKAIEKAGEATGEAAAEQGGGLAKTIWEKVKGLFGSQKDQTALALLEEHPDSAAKLIEEILAKKLAENPGLAQELSQLVEKHKQTASEGVSVVVHGDGNITGTVSAGGTSVTGSENVTFAGVQMGQPPESPRKA